MSKNPYRRAQLITTFGVGALNTTPNGTSVICCGLDHWFENTSGIDPNEFIIREWRLEKQLNVSEFRLPPDFRSRPRNRFSTQNEETNLLIYIPTLRFPTWHFCTFCRKMYKHKSHTTLASNCMSCENNGKRNRLVQVQFVSVCRNGHIDEFPWFEWAHSRIKGSIKCNKINPKLKLRDKGASSLEGLVVECEDCGSKRSLQGSLGSENYPTLSSLLIDADGNSIACNGSEPWNSNVNHNGCGEDIIGSLRSASDIYYSNTKTSIYVPRDKDASISKIVNLMSQTRIKNFIDDQVEFGSSSEININPRIFKEGKSFRGEFNKYSDQQIQKALDIVLQKNISEEAEDVSDEEFRRPEFTTFLKNNYEDRDTLESELIPLDEFNDIIGKYFQSINLIKKLTETKALYGFSRKEQFNENGTRENINLLWKNVPAQKNLWLPAVQVGGEGIFIQFKEDLVKNFERDKLVNERIEKFRNIERNPRRPINLSMASARYILMHTFAHTLINTLIFECGYGASSLQERIYCSSENDKPMAGILIYTSAGDTSGTMGGLVRMGRPGYFEKIFEKTLENSIWCSVDPVCMEISEFGQGPNSCNMACCHNCALVPETACESFNSYLDRALVCGTLENKNLGFFTRNG